MIRQVHDSVSLPIFHCHVLLAIVYHPLLLYWGIAFYLLNFIKEASSAEIVSQQLQLSVLLHILLHNGMPTFETEVLRFYSKAQLLK